MFQGAQFDPTIMAVALPREIIEIEIPDTAGLDVVPYGDEMGDSVPMGPGGALPKRRYMYERGRERVLHVHVHGTCCQEMADCFCLRLAWSLIHSHTHTHAHAHAHPHAHAHTHTQSECSIHRDGGFHNGPDLALHAYPWILLQSRV